MPEHVLMSEIEIITDGGRRRRWTAAEKLRIVEETLDDSASISVVARRNGVAPNLLYRWRCLMLEGGSVAASLAPMITRYGLRWSNGCQDYDLIKTRLSFRLMMRTSVRGCPHRPVQPGGRTRRWRWKAQRIRSGRVSDLLCMSDPVHASPKGSMHDDLQGTSG